MNSRKQGSIAVAQAIAWFTSNGYNVSVPLAETQRYDLVVEKDGTCYRVEVKSSISDEVMLRTFGGNQSWGGVANRLSTEDAEYLFASTKNGLFLIPTFLITQRATIKPDAKFLVGQYASG